MPADRLRRFNLRDFQHLRNVLQAKGYPVHYAEFSVDYNDICWQGTLADGFIAPFNAERRST